ncbi:MAG: hypothetical protein ACTSXF_03705 [Promethearchaeota archaeon]
MTDKIEELANKLSMFENGFKAIASNLESQLKKVDQEVKQLEANTSVIPKIKKDNKEMFKTLNSISATIGELIRRLDLMESNKML